MQSGLRIGAALAVSLISTAALAENDLQRTRDTFVSIYASRWSDTSLPVFPLRLATGNLRLRPTSFVAAGVNRVIESDFTIAVPLTGIALRHNSVEVETQVVQHFGRQDHVEATAAFVLRTGEIPLLKRSSLNFALANGLSYAFAKPKYELGAAGIRGVGTRNLQFHIGIEAELTPVRGSGFHIVAKLHHRSGIYGIISPRRTGSNFIGGGIRFDL